MNSIEEKPRGDEFRQLREIVDQDKLAERLQQYLRPVFASDEMQIEDCKIEQLYYTSGVTCQIVFTAKIHYRRSQEFSEGIFFGTHMRLQYPSALASFDSLNRRIGARPQAGSALIYIPEWEMLLWAYPNNPTDSHQYRVCASEPK
jgi:hypothetical protein